MSRPAPEASTSTPGRDGIIEIRPRLDDDLPALAVVLARVHESDGYPVKVPPDPVAWLSGSRTRRSWVASLGGLVVGQVSTASADGDYAEGVWLRALECESGDLAVVKRLFVDPTARGRGLGRTLLDTVVADAHLRGLHPVLDVDAKAAYPNALYRSCGFQEVGTVDLTWTGLGGRFSANCYVGPPPGPRLDGA
ncbi:MAG: GNAT family N-acetyltransferase [Acidimicrobiales bacterium]